MTAHPGVVRLPLELRCSALPLAMTCPGSVRPEGLTIDESGAASAAGDAAHEGLADLVETGRMAWGDVTALARRHGADEGEVRALLSLGVALWREVGAMFPAAASERELTYRDPGGAFVLTGHADVVAWLPGRVRVADWKTGRRDADYREQLVGYCVLALGEGESFGADAADAFVLWLRDGEVERHGMRRRDVAAWLDRVRRRVVDWNGRYHVGPHCAHCPRSHECPAGRALARRDVVAVRDVAPYKLEGDALERLSPDDLVELLGQADHVAAIAGRVRAAIRTLVKSRGEVVGSSKRLSLQHEERRELDVLAALPVLEAAGLTDDDLAEVITLSLAVAENIVAKRAPRGKGAATVRALDAALEQAGAIRTTTTTKLVVKRA